MPDQLVESLRATADGNGVARASTQPPRYGEEWTVTGMATTSDSTTDCELRVYKGGEFASGLVANSYAGRGDSAGGSPVKVLFGQELTAVWTGCTPGAQCTLTIQGERTVRGIR